jgi:uncharacterized tellurite resistance protein B-like protein
MVEEFRAAMLDAVQDFFEERLRAATEKHRLQLATAALFIEMTRADFEIRPEESKAVTRAVVRALDMSPEETAQIVELAEQEVDAAGSLHQFARLIDRRFSMEQKKRVVKLLWQVAFSDAELEGHEEYLVRKISNMLHLPLADFLDAKIRAREDFR